MAGVKLIHYVNVQISDRARTRDCLDRGPLNQRQLQLRIGTGGSKISYCPLWEIWVILSVYTETFRGVLN